MVTGIIQQQNVTEIISPPGDVVFQQNVLISWRAEDEDDDPLTFPVGISNDGGDTWHTLITDYENTSIEFDRNSTLLNATSNFLVRLRVTDGFLSAEDILNVSFSINPECADLDGDSVCDVSDNCIED